MKIGIIGLPQSGKTTVFNAAAGRSETVGDFSKASHRAVIKVPDHRLDRLSELTHPKKTTHAEIDYIDLCAFSGRGKESDAAALIIPEDLRYAQVLMVVIDCFSPSAAPERHFNLFNEELILADQIIIERNLDKRRRQAQLASDKDAARECELLEKCLKAFEEAQPLTLAGLTDEEKELLRNYSFLSLKPLLVVLNIAESELAQAASWPDRFRESHIAGAREFVALCGKIEMELAQLESGDRQVFLAELGLERPAMETLINKSYSLLGLISFFTLNENEARAWTIKSGTTARKAAGTVHSDMERGFIRAEVMHFGDVDTLGSPAAVREAGRYRLEGKDYIVSDGDVILFRFNL